MHDTDLTLPWFTSQWWIFCVFIVSWAIFHVLLVRLFPLSSIRWKQVDYVWLAMALLGIIGSVSGNRAVIAENLQSMATARSTFALREVMNSAEFGTSIAICRQFVTSEFSPPPDVMEKTQRQFNAQCDWFKKVSEVLRAYEKDSAKQIDIVRLVGEPPTGGEAWAYSRFAQSVALYNDSLEDLDSLNKAKSNSGIESVFRFLGPLLIALALALRITKVSGEVALERQRERERRS